jgi:hypothetical protein
VHPAVVSLGMRAVWVCELTPRDQRRDPYAAIGGVEEDLTIFGRTRCCRGQRGCRQCWYGHIFKRPTRQSAAESASQPVVAQTTPPTAVVSAPPATRVSQNVTCRSISSNVAGAEGLRVRWNIVVLRGRC